MTTKYHGAIVHCHGRDEETYRRAISMVRLLAHVDAVETQGGSTFLLTFAGDVRDDDFQEGIGVALNSFSFVRQVKPISTGSFRSPYQGAIDVNGFVMSLKPPAPAMPLREVDLDEYLGKMRDWICIRDAVMEATGRILKL